MFNIKNIFSYFIENALWPHYNNLYMVREKIVL
jgi:hypothetical protein